VLVPLAEVSPGLVIPGSGKPVETLMQQVDPSGVVEFQAEKGEKDET